MIIVQQAFENRIRLVIDFIKMIIGPSSEIASYGIPRIGLAVHFLRRNATNISKNSGASLTNFSTIITNLNLKIVSVTFS